MALLDKPARFFLTKVTHSGFLRSQRVECVPKARYCITIGKDKRRGENEEQREQYGDDHEESGTQRCNRTLCERTPSCEVNRVLWHVHL